MSTKVIADEVDEDVLSLEKGLGFLPTSDQKRAIYTLARLLSSNQAKRALILKGYAGTGKTSLLSSLVKLMKSKKIAFQLMAPTGRAAKVISSYSRHPAYTIHRCIYRRMQDGQGRSRFVLKENKRKKTLFIVDEASMIGDGMGLGTRSLLSDLMEYVFAQEGCSLILIGDEGQLPPVGLLNSPALDIDKLRAEFDLAVAQVKMTQVVRQAQDSGVLLLATALRAKASDETMPDPMNSEYPDVIKLSSQDLEEALTKEYDILGPESVRIICRSNKDALKYNLEVRSRIFQYDEKLHAGEMLMVVKNNYLWADDDDKLPFIANGELCEVSYSKEHREMYDLEFANVGLTLKDHALQLDIECKMMLDCLYAKGPSMDSEEMDRLYKAVKADLAYEYKGTALKEAVRKDPWFNALQVKYGYAVTCHKSQGGQWPVVFIDKGYLPEGKMDKEFWRWLYTAVTRATERVYIIN